MHVRIVCVPVYKCMATLVNSPNLYLPLLSARRAHTHTHKNTSTVSIRAKLDLHKYACKSEKSATTYRY